MSPTAQTQTMSSDEHFMSLALCEAGKAFKRDEVPVGAVIVHEGKIIARGFNQTETKQDATQHAEMIAIRHAAQKLKSWRLEKCRLYVTLEPCAMCSGAIIWSRIERLIYGSPDPKAGACGSVLNVIGNKCLHHQPTIQAGVLAQASSQLLKEFFQSIRQRKKKLSII